METEVKKPEIQELFTDLREISAEVRDEIIQQIDKDQKEKEENDKKQKSN